MSEKELNDGRQLRRKLLGDAYVDRIAATTYKDPQMHKFIDLASETVFGTLWTRAGIDLKTRTLVTVVADASTGREPELAIHLRMARRQGWSEDELIEVLLHLMGYVGAPLVRDAMLVATKVFAEMRAEGPQALA
jgi:4-carboxymuconolactone decarboxylase